MTPFAWILLLGLVAAPAGTLDPTLGGDGARGITDAKDAPKPDEKPTPKPPEAPKPDEKPAPPKAPEAPKPPAKGKKAPTCSLPSEEGPRGGRLVIEGDNFGRTPVVRIGDRVTRILLREDKNVSVQIPRDSDGGPVTVEAEGVRAACGWLTIVGKDR